MGIFSVSSWANELGGWTVRVSANEVEDKDAAKRAATARIRSELMQREGPSFDPETVTVVLGLQSIEAEQVVFYFTEEV